MWGRQKREHGEYAWVKQRHRARRRALGCCNWQIKAMEAWFVLADRGARGQARLHEGAATKTSQSGGTEHRTSAANTCTHTHSLSLSHTPIHAGVHIRSGMWLYMEWRTNPHRAVGKSKRPWAQYYVYMFYKSCAHTHTHTIIRKNLDRLMSFLGGGGLLSGQIACSSNK